MAFTSKFIPTEGRGRLRCARPTRAFDVGRQLETSIGAVVVMLLVGFVALVSHSGEGQAHGQAATTFDTARPQIVRTTVRVIPIFSQQADDQGRSNSGS